MNYEKLNTKLSKQRKVFFFLLIALFFNGLSVNGQVTIGDNTSPQDYSVLEISTVSTKGGLRLPQLNTIQRNGLKLDELASSDNEKARGLAIFNIETQCFEYWNSSKWISLCESEHQEGTVDFSGCNSISVSGVYDTDLTPNKQNIRIIVPVEVTELGSYRYEAVVNNVTFVARGTYVNFGPQDVYLYPSTVSGPVQSGVTLNATLTIGPLTDNTYVICDEIPIRFVSRSTSILKILNLTGGEDYWDITSSDGGNNRTNNPVDWAARWVKGEYISTTSRTALEYSGTAGIQIVSLNPTAGGAIATLDELLEEVSIVWVGANDNASRFNSGIVTVLRDWATSGQGYIVTVADKISGGSIPQNLGLIIEDGSSVNGFTTASNLPEIFKGTDVPYDLANGLEVARDGSNAGYITCKGGITFLQTGSGVSPVRRLGVYNPATNTFGFADKFGQSATYSSSGGFPSNGSGSTATGYNLQRILIDIWAYMLANAPIK
ncbi:hypothetical protein [uncultured Dysgonomonas sp.]|uniref:Uncharacterized protein n=1 Tax=uncultured Dysgonomonas sp. TaxID=206096 RepID=A0A212JJV9_9BACT|nr:hypothetical protein [uncultured Dysgonomonas sp.]SBV99701.1 exported hypothetical protein [uncultured Dysgonomonas sp.]